MSVDKTGSARSKRIEVRGFHHGVPAHVTDPVVLVVDDDEEDVGLIRGVDGSHRKRDGYNDLKLGKAQGAVFHEKACVLY